MADTEQPCPICHGARWVCEGHPTQPWTDEAAMRGEAGVPCPKCNQPEAQPENR